MAPITDNVVVRNDAQILIVARSDRPRDSLRILLKTKPWLKVVGQTDDSAQVLELVTQHCPAVVILDANLSGNGAWVDVLQQIKTASPETRCLVLADNYQQKGAAERAGADAALFKGFAGAELFDSIAGVLSAQEIRSIND